MTTFETHQDTPPEGFVSHIIESAALTPEESEAKIRSIIAETWARARQDEAVDVQGAALRYVEADILMVKKIARVRDVIRNTINKRNLKTPAQFQWVHAWSNYAIVGIYRNVAASYQSPSYTSLNTLSARGVPVKVDRNDFIKVRAEGHRNDQNFIPLRWLNASDGELAKMVRTQVRNDAAKDKADKMDTLLREKALVEKNLLKLQRQIDEITPKKV